MRSSRNVIPSAGPSKEIERARCIAQIDVLPPVPRTRAYSAKLTELLCAIELPH